MMPLPEEFFNRDAKLVGKEILGKLLVRRLGNAKLVGKIVETEAYYGAKDPASRARKSKNLDKWWRAAKPSTVFVYMVHGNWLLNIVTSKVNNEPSGILIRALEPLKGVEVMMKRRRAKEIEGLVSGPGKLTQAFGITSSYTGLSVCKRSSKLIVTEGLNKNIKILRSYRIGVKEDLPEKLRFYIADNKFVSR
ncbi:MAG: DNA-3-methyladenine glycosylase [Candidatus Thermoplasmatota archaeon]